MKLMAKGETSQILMSDDAVLVNKPKVYSSEVDDIKISRAYV